MSEDELFTGSDSGVFFGISSGNTITMTTAATGGLLPKNKENPWDKVYSWFAKKPELPPKLLSIPEFFSSLKNSTEELEIVKEHAANYEKLVQLSKERGQVALVEKLMKGAGIARTEAQLVAMGEWKYLTEKTVVAFAKQSERGLRLDYLRNFVRLIPDELAAKKKRADELCIFDNYAVLHYDPEAKSYAQTEQEKKEEEARKRDPILFGLLQGSERLYYLGDWIDEFCDLTLDQIVAKLGSEVLGELPTGGN